MGCLPHVTHTSSHHLAIHYPCPALPQNNFALEMLLPRSKVEWKWGIWRSFSSFLKNAHFPPGTGIHEQQERRRPTRAVPPIPTIHNSHSSIRQFLSRLKISKKKKYIFKIVIIKTKKPLQPSDKLQKLICSCITSARPSFQAPCSFPIDTIAVSPSCFQVSPTNISFLPAADLIKTVCCLCETKT